MKKKPLPCVAVIRDALDYNPLTGALTWRITKSTVRQGNVAGYVKKDGYRYVRLNGVKYLAHRLVWVHVYGTDPVDQIDHINGVTDDNRIINLREASDNLNQQNLQKATRRNKSGYLGVYPSGKKWRAVIQIGGKNTHLGAFDTAYDAHLAYLRAKRDLHPFGEIAKLPEWLLP